MPLNATRIFQRSMLLAHSHESTGLLGKPIKAANAPAHDDVPQDLDCV